MSNTPSRAIAIGACGIVCDLGNGISTVVDRWQAATSTPAATQQLHPLDKELDPLAPLAEADNSVMVTISQALTDFVLNYGEQPPLHTYRVLIALPESEAGREQEHARPLAKVVPHIMGAPLEMVAIECQPNASTSVISMGLTLMTVNPDINGILVLAAHGLVEHDPRQHRPVGAAVLLRRPPKRGPYIAIEGSALASPDEERFGTIPQLMLAPLRRARTTMTKVQRIAFDDTPSERLCAPDFLEAANHLAESTWDGVCSNPSLALSIPGPASPLVNLLVASELLRRSPVDSRTLWVSPSVCGPSALLLRRRTKRGWFERAFRR